MKREYALFLSYPLPEQLATILEDYTRDKQGTPWILCNNVVQDGSFLSLEAVGLKDTWEMLIPIIYVQAVMADPQERPIGFNAKFD